MWYTSSKKITYGNNKKYEIFWITDYVLHIYKRQEHASHKISFKEVEDFAVNPIYIEYKDVIVGLGIFKNKPYKVIVKLVDRSKNKRCIIKTCHIIKESDLRDICFKLFNP